jgi:ABC-type dipeptide/oligopeptide/nickel transport system permease subunit
VKGTEYRDGTWFVGINVLAFGIALAFWWWLWPPGIAIPVVFSLWRLAKACY